MMKKWRGSFSAFLGAEMLVWLFLAFITRLAMLISSFSDVSHNALDMVKVFFVGAVYDIYSFIFLAIPLVLYLLIPQHFLSAKVHRRILGFGMWLLHVVLILICVSLYLYWQEFHTNFNFIAVDYLIYSQEMFGVIFESFPMGKILFGIAVLSALLTFFLRSFLPKDFSFSLRREFVLLAAVIFLPLLVATHTSASVCENLTENRYSNELSASGPYAFTHAYFANDLDYFTFYRTMKNDEAVEALRENLSADNVTYLSSEGVRRHVENKNALTGKRPNVIIITVESLSSDFCGAFGGEMDNTPYLNAMAEDSYLFTNTFATGTRTVRGLEAISLSVPPTPGQSILRRENYAGLSTLGDAFAQNGYKSDFLYGGYGYFDNMNAFFSENGYTVKDRLSIPSDEIFNETIWGVADEILFTQVLRSMDEHAAAGEPAFEMVMTTSNHRPFHFPEGRVEGEQGTREGAVRYTDWAIHDFIERARQKPWFQNTVFVVIADHQASAAGKSDLPMERYRIPFLVYAPGLIAPGKTDRLTSQMDVGPTVLGMLGLSYTSTFLGHDVLHTPDEKLRAFISTYQDLGLVKDGQMIELTPNKEVKAYQIMDWSTGAYSEEALPANLEKEAISWYQGASYLYKNGFLRAD